MTSNDPLRPIDGAHLTTYLLNDGREQGATYGTEWIAEDEIDRVEMRPLFTHRVKEPIGTAFTIKFARGGIVSAREKLVAFILAHQRAGSASAPVPAIASSPP